MQPPMSVFDSLQANRSDLGIILYQCETPGCLEMNGEPMNWSEMLVLFFSLK